MGPKGKISLLFHGRGPDFRTGKILLCVRDGLTVIYCAFIVYHRVSIVSVSSEKAQHKASVI